MIKSMTGFGRGEYSDEKRNIIVEIKTVNHRYCDLTVKMPRRYGFAEDRIKNVVKDTVRRGKADISVVVESVSGEDSTVKLNTPMARQYFESLKELADTFSLSGNISIQMLAGMPDVIKLVPDIEDEEEILRSLLIPVQEACKALDEMRSKEGEKLAEDLVKRGEYIREIARKIKDRSPLVVEMYMDKMQERIKDLLGKNVAISEDRILTEAALFADKCNVTEELVRLDSHVAQLENIIKNSSEPDGKKMDFLVQEMNREANTIGSKANDLETTNLMLEIKAEIEKIREQVQNIQ